MDKRVQTPPSGNVNRGKEMFPEELSEDTKKRDYTTVVCKVLLHRSDAEDFKTELQDWLMGHRMGLSSIEIEEE